MSEMGGAEAAGAGFNGADTSGEQQATGDNPAWSELLNLLPTQFHNQVKPHLQKWDQGVQQRFQQVHSQYEPWKGIIDAGINPQDVDYALNVLTALNDNPQKVYEALAEHLGINGSEDEQGGAEEEEEGEEYVDPRIQELQEGYQNLAQITLAQHQEQEDSEADEELDEYLSDLTEAYGEFDERYVLALMQSGMDGEEAVQEFQNTVTSAQTAANRPPAPTVMSPGGGQPSQAINPSQLDSRGRRDMVAKMLAANAEQSRL